MCCSPCFAACCLSCSEAVGNAACNPTLCSDCLTGTQAPEAIPCATDITAGQTVPLCDCKAISSHCYPCSPDSHGASDPPPVDVSACLPYAGQDGNGNEIYRQSDGSLVYSDGSPATKADLVCTKCSCNPALSCKNPSSGSGSAGSSAGGKGGGSPRTATPPKPAGGTSAGKQMTLGTKLGSVFSGLFSGGKTVSAASTLPGLQKSRNAVTPISSNTMLLIIIIVGVLLLMMVFGREQ